MWTVTFQPQKGDVGTLIMEWQGSAPEDVFGYSVSVDLAQVTDLAPFADKIKALKAEHDAEKAQPPKYQAALDALANALNGGK